MPKPPQKAARSSGHERQARAHLQPHRHAGLRQTGLDMMSLVIAGDPSSHHLWSGYQFLVPCRWSDGPQSERTSNHRGQTGAEARGNIEIAAWTLRRNHVCCRNFGLAMPNRNASQGFVVAGSPWYETEPG
jgi:hypothetical protein